MQDTRDPTQAQGAPGQLALSRARRYPRGELQSLTPEVLDRGVRGPGLREGVEQQPHAVLNLLVWVEHDMVSFVIDQAHGKTAAQLSPACLVEQAAAHPTPQHVQLGLTHRALETQQ